MRGAIILSSVLLCAAPAWARGASLVAGPLRVMDGEQYACMAVNTTSRLIENVTLQLRSISGGSLGTVECPAVEPWEVCTGGVPTALSDLVVTCEATSDRGAKGLRMTLMNVTTGGTSDAR